MQIIGLILARAGSKGLPDKCLRRLGERAVIEYTFEHAVASRRLSAIVLSTDCEPAKELARGFGIEVIDRPAELATDTVTVDAAARHAVEAWESRHGQGVDAVALLYGNVPIRGPGLIDRAIDQLLRTKADSVRSVAPVGKYHPDWMFRLDGDRMSPFRPNSIYRRQDLEPFFHLDGAIAVVTRQALFDAAQMPEDKQAFLGRDRRAIVQRSDDAVDIDEPIDLCIAEAVLRARSEDRGLAEKSKGPKAQTIDDRQSTIDSSRDFPTVNIGSHRIGAGGWTLVIAEAGVSHNGSVDAALRLVDAAAEAGADAVKFQMFRADQLVTASGATAEYQKAACGAESQRQMLRALELAPTDFARIKRRCDERGVLFVATPFGDPELRHVVELGAAAIKIASTDLTNTPLLEHAASTGLPIVLSTGASTEAEVRDAVAVLRGGGAGNRLILLHCVSCYPTPMEALNLRAIEALRRQFGVPCGLSDHTTSLQAGGLAVAAGACVLEKHLTLGRNAAGPDHAMSLDPPQLREYIRAVREAEAMLGDGRVGLTAREHEVRRLAGKSVVSTQPIPAGTPLSRSMLCIKRPGTGILPVELPSLLNRRAAVDIPDDTVLTWDMVQ